MQRLKPTTKQINLPRNPSRSEVDEMKWMFPVLASWAAMFLVACSDPDTADLQRYITEVKARPGQSIGELPKMKEIEFFLFDPTGLRNPFVPVDVVLDEQQIAEEVGSGVRPDFSRPREELEMFPLDSLRMVGTLVKDELRWALIVGADGTIHRVRAGNYMGKNHGKILEIGEDRISLLELVPDIKPGTWREQQTTIALVERQ
ncbi:MAG: pilus assembly protein PilP [Methylococcales bacterium]|nr:pilus assembly protein PilP [Methylococcales bacterium]